MPIRVKVPGHGIVEFPDGTPQEEMAKALSSLTDAPDVKTDPQRSWLDTAKDVAIGVGKGAASTVASLGEAAGQIRSPFNPLAGKLSDAVDQLYGKPGLSKAAFAAADEATTATNTPQRVGKVLEGAAELALPVGAGAKAAVEAIPSTARAGAAFKDVMGAARAIPVNTEAPGQVGLRIMQLAERGGGSLPRPVSQFLQRITHPDKAPIAYEEARDFASGISRLSANEFQRMTPAVAREVAGLRVTLNKAVAEAASKAGKGAEYSQAMKEYAKAMKLKTAIDDIAGAAKKAVPYGLATGAVGAVGAGAYWLTKHVTDLLGGD